MNRVQALSAFRYRDFQFLWVSNLSRSTGMWIQMVVLGWLVLEMTNSPFLVALVISCRWVPQLFLGIPAGVAADRIDRRKLILATTTFWTILPIPIAILILAGLIQFWHTLVFALLGGVAMALTAPSQQALMRDIVGEEDLANAISVNSAGISAMRILGAAAGGILIESIGTAGCFYFMAACYLGSVASIYMIRRAPKPSASAQEPIWSNLIEGLRYVASNRILLIIFGSQIVLGVLVWPYIGLMPVFARDVLGVGASGLGFLNLALGAGGLAAALGVAVSGNIRRKGWLLLGSTLALTIVTFLFSQSPWYPISLFILFITGAMTWLFLILTNTIMLAIAPEELRGRVVGIRTLTVAAMPAGNMLLGALANITGAPLALGLGSGIAIVYSLGLILGSASMRRLD